ncbi:hypothetical protein HUU40_24950 [candidate division KSB1 bacterium]|nr:hypothetical protein [candidate division KSB1 bacterium]
MNTAKMEVEQLLKKLPDNCSIEDIQYHLYVLEKIRKGLASADTKKNFSQEEAEKQLGKWFIK